MLKKIITIIFFIPVLASAYISPGQPTGFVSDFANVLSAEQKASLETKLSQFERDSSNEIVLVTIKSLGGDTVENYAEKLFADWGIGKDGRDNGILLLVAVEDRKMRIEVGYGLEGALTDIQSHSIITNDLTPAFKQGKYYEGLDRAVDDIALATRGEYTAPEGGTSVDEIESFFGIIFGIGVVIMWLVAALARSKSWWAGGVVGGVLAAAITQFFGLIYVGLLSFVVLIPMGLLLDYLVSGAYQRGVKTGHYPWWIGGGPWNDAGGLGGGGFGGFGGGHSGGGGSSGSW